MSEFNSDGLKLSKDGKTVIRCRSNIISVKIPESVTIIDEGAFRNCRMLTSIELPSGISAIGSSAFNGCIKLTSIVLPEGMDSIGSCAFDGCTRLESIVIPSGIFNIYYGTFRDCESLISITLPEGITRIADRAFYNCRSLKSLTLPSTLMSIGESAFVNCSSLESIVIPKDIESIYCGSFAGTAPTTVTAAWVPASMGKNKLNKYIIPDGVKRIYTCELRDCKSLTSLVIPESVTSIGSRAFQGCTNLSDVKIPESVTSIGYKAFHGSKFMKSKRKESDEGKGCISIIGILISLLLFIYVGYKLFSKTSRSNSDPSLINKSDCLMRDGKLINCECNIIYKSLDNDKEIIGVIKDKYLKYPLLEIRPIGSDYVYYLPSDPENCYHGNLLEYSKCTKFNILTRVRINNSSIYIVNKNDYLLK